MTGADALVDRHRLELMYRFPDFERIKGALVDPVIDRRAQPLRSGADAGAGLRLIGRSGGAAA